MRRLCKEIAGALPEADIEARVRRDWDALGVAVKRRLYSQAETQLRAELGADQVSQKVVLARAQHLMDAEAGRCAGPATPREADGESPAQPI